MAPPWSSALTEYARTANPASLPANVLIAYDEHTLTIQDAYPKAQYHYLVLPRMPWRLTKEEWEEVEREIAKGKEGEAGDGGKEPEQAAQQKQGKQQQQQLNFAGGAMGLARPAATTHSTAQASSSSTKNTSASSSSSSNSNSQQHIIPPTHLLNLSTLLTSPYRSIILHHLSRAAHAAEQRIRSLMPQTHVDGLGQQQTVGCTWDVQVGFHAVPSMDTVHCHVLSGELVSERLKNKKHYLSFSPHAGFFLPLPSFLPNPPDRLPHPASHYESLLKGPLVSHVDRRTYPNIPALKRHLSEAWLRGLVEGRKKEVGGGEGGSSGGSSSRERGVAVPTVGGEGEHSETEDEEEEREEEKRPEKRLKLDGEEANAKEGEVEGAGKGDLVSDGSHTESGTGDEAV